MHKISSLCHPNKELVLLGGEGMPLSDKGSEPYHPVAMLKYSAVSKGVRQVAWELC